MENSKSLLVGKYFHIFEDDKLCRQGQIISQESDDRYLIEFFDWSDGSTDEMRLVGIGDMSEWSFYSDSETMRYRQEKWSKEQWG
ncbi:MAG: hypothetical protein E3K36_04325 [Candidatus Brocadia sp.]|nr:hypothetical protein [Candidatus Brocadia sp.]